MPPLPPVSPHEWPAVGLLRAYRYTLSSVMGRQCRHWPSCSEYAEEAIRRHGLWAGSWIGFARICRCGPGGTHGIDIVCEEVPAKAAWYAPWRYGRWRGVNAPVPAALPLGGGGDSALIKAGDKPDSSSDTLRKR
ncbi:MAG: membrane protein insertion efficiency factor YidD [Beijerinckiaceae bacterium]